MPYPLRFMLAIVTLALLGLAVFSAMSFASKPPVPIMPALSSAIHSMPTI